MFPAVVLCILIIPATAIADGAKSSAMGMAFTAVADDASASSSNPAGLVQSRGADLYGGVSAVKLTTTYESPSGQMEKTEHRIYYVPHLFAVSDTGSTDARIGVGIFSPFGIGGRTWSNEGLTRYASTENIIGTLTVNPTIAYQITPALSAGFGIDYMMSNLKSGEMVDQSALGAGDGEISIRADGHGWGYNAGILYTASDAWRLGLAYRSRIKVNYDGSFDYTSIAPAIQPLFGGTAYHTAMQTSLTFPDIVSFGISYKPSTAATLAFELEQTRWSSFNRVDIDLQNEVSAAGLSDSSMNKDWHDVLAIKIGMEYKLSDRLAFRAGYFYMPDPIPEYTLGPDNPDATTNNITLGAGYSANGLTVDVYYMATLYERRTVDNAILSGSYDNSMHTMGVSVGYRY